MRLGLSALILWLLRAGSLVWFTPGLIHRLINQDCQLEIFAVMENAGLPEHGDSVLTFPSEHLADEDRYLHFASLERAGSAFSDTREAAERRRDLAVEGFLFNDDTMSVGDEGFDV